MTPPPTGQRIFDGAYLRGTLFTAVNTTNAKSLIVRFEARDKNKTGFKPTDTIASLAAQGHAVLSLQTAGNDWFINPDTSGLCAVLTALAAKHPNPRLIGFSMGGYAAFRFARVLGAAWVVAVSPQYSIAPATVPWDKRYRAEGANFDPTMGDIAPHAMPGLRGVIYFDPFKLLDLRHCRMLQAQFPRVMALRLPGGGHPATKLMGVQGRIGPVIKSVAGGRDAAVAVQRLHRKLRHFAPFYRDALAQATRGRF